MNSAPLSDKEASRLLRELFDRVQARTTHVQHEDWMTLRPGSLLEQDDDLTEPYQVSHSITSGIINAIEALHAIGVHLVARVRFPSVPFILTRVAMESAANVVWTLEPRNRNERIRRSLLLRVLDVKDFHGFRGRANFAPMLDKAAHKEKVQEVAERATGSRLLRREIDECSSTSRVKAAAQLVSTEFDCLLTWMVGSGFAHGRPWASIVALEASDQSEVGGTVLRQRWVSSLSNIVWAVGSAEAMLGRALSLYHQRGAFHPDATPEEFASAQGLTEARQQQVIDADIRFF